MIPKHVHFIDGWDAGFPREFPSSAISDIRDALRLQLLKEGDQAASTYRSAGGASRSLMTTLHYRGGLYCNAYWRFRENDEEAEVFSAELLLEKPPPIERPPLEN